MLLSPTLARADGALSVARHAIAGVRADNVMALGGRVTVVGHLCALVDV